MKKSSKKAVGCSVFVNDHRRSRNFCSERAFYKQRLFIKKTFMKTNKQSLVTYKREKDKVEISGDAKEG